MEDFGFSPPHGEGQEATRWSRRERGEVEDVEGVHQGFLGVAYVEEPLHSAEYRSRVHIEEEMDVAAVGVGE